MEQCLLQLFVAYPDSQVRSADSAANPAAGSAANPAASFAQVNCQFLDKIRSRLI